MDDLLAIVSSGTAIVATCVSLFLLRQGQQDRRDLRRERERAQASKVTAWCDWNSCGDDATFAKPRLPAIFVANASDAAIYDVFLDFHEPVSGALMRASVGPVPPGHTRVRPVDYKGSLIEGWEPAALLARVNFRDASGDRWLRDALGRLRVDPGAGNDEFFSQGGVLLPPD